MKITDLQINDWVYDGPGKGFPMQVAALFADGDMHLDFEENQGDVWESNIKDIAPIPICYNILKNSEFTFELNGFITYNGFILQIEKLEGNVYRVKATSRITNFTTCDIYIRYVHELQHIFRMFGGKELEVKL